MVVRSEMDDAGQAIARAMSRPDDDAVGSGSYSMDCSSDDSRRTPRLDMAEMGSRPTD